MTNRVKEVENEIKNEIKEVEEKLKETNKRLENLERITLKIENEYGYKIDVIYENRYELYNKTIKNEINIA